MVTINRPPLYKIYTWQLVISLLISGLFWFVNEVQGYSFFAGCLIQISGNLYFARLAYRYQGASQAGSMVKSMYRGETGKIVLTAALFATVFTIVKPLNAVFLFAGYIVMVILHLLLATKILTKHKF